MCSYPKPFLQLLITLGSDWKCSGEISSTTGEPLHLNQVYLLGNNTLSIVVCFACAVPSRVYASSYLNIKNIIIRLIFTQLCFYRRETTILQWFKVFKLETRIYYQIVISKRTIWKTFWCNACLTLDVNVSIRFSHHFSINFSMVTWKPCLALANDLRLFWDCSAVTLAWQITQSVLTLCRLHSPALISPPSKNLFSQDRNIKCKLINVHKNRNYLLPGRLQQYDQHAMHFPPSDQTPTSPVWKWQLY